MSNVCFELCSVGGETHFTQEELERAFKPMACVLKSAEVRRSHNTALSIQLSCTAYVNSSFDLPKNPFPFLGALWMITQIDYLSGFPPR